MWAKACKKILWVLAIVTLLGSAALAAPSSSLLAEGRNNIETSLERDLEGRVIVTCDNVTKIGNVVFVEYTILSEEDLVVKVSEVGSLFDYRGGRLAPVTTVAIAEIGGEVSNEREIIAGVTTRIRTRYIAPAIYELAEKYARVSITINGRNLIFRDIPSNATNQTLEQANAAQITDLSNYVYNFDYTGDVQSINLPAGVYLFECWGAQGGDMNGFLGGKGGYTRGCLAITQYIVLYIHVGGSGGGGDAGGYNGGGTLVAGESAYGRAGGGASDIRLSDAVWHNIHGLRSRLMVAAGGGGANNRNVRPSGGPYGDGNGGFGGGLLGGDGTSVNNSPNGWGFIIGTGGAQTAGGLSQGTAGRGTGTSVAATGQFGIGGAQSGNGQSGGGGGWYGGGIGGHGGAGGGSSFISGHPGCDAITSETSSTHTGQPNHYSGLIFTETQMMAGNESMPNPRGSGNITGNTGHGFIRIMRLW